ncbi:MAG: glycine cleavage system protein GcvH [Candidatus Poseidoniia archaeon]|jgi:glycine cleavage system H protein|nr:glycine cleavage system protein GcvH [Candidatus Poseidoniia archaeon]
MNAMTGELKFSTNHEWVRLEQDNVAVVGITDFAQGLLGDIVFVELPEVGQQVQLNDEIAVVESLKAASDIYSPISGVILEINEALSDQPEVINSSPDEQGWLYKIEYRNLDELNQLLSPDDYNDLCQSES